MIERYTDAEMGRVWIRENKFDKWMEVEILVCEAMYKKGLIPERAFLNIKENARYDISRIDELEKITKHDVAAFIINLSENIGDDARFLHLGLTSSDILDTTLALLLKEAGKIIIKDLNALLHTLKAKAFKYKDTKMIGRTHGIHAEPITFGIKIAIWFDEMRRNLMRMKNAVDIISYGKISGATGTFTHVSPEIEAYICEKLGLKPAPVSSQIIQRDRHAEYFTTLAIIATSIEKIATEIRHLQRTEVYEVEEFFSEGQKGSSAMPHKRNPIASENLCGLARVVRGNSMAALENVPLWHERDISHSSVERIIAPDSTILVDYMLKRLNTIIEKLVVYEDNMLKNLQKMRGLIFSQRIMLELILKGVNRDNAYTMVQRNAMKVWDREEDFQEIVSKDTEITSYLTKNVIERIFDIDYNLRNVDTIFKRVFEK